MPSQDLAIAIENLRLQLIMLVHEITQRTPNHWRDSFILLIANNLHQELKTNPPDRSNHAELCHVRADAVSNTGSVADQRSAEFVHCKHTLLLYRLHFGEDCSEPSCLVRKNEMPDGLIAGCALVETTRWRSLEIVLGALSAEVTTIATEAVTRRLAWRSGMLAFDGDTLADATLEIERQTGVRFQFAAPSIAQLRIGGYISATDVDAFVELVETNLNVRAERREGVVVFGS